MKPGVTTLPVVARRRSPTEAIDPAALALCHPPAAFLFPTFSTSNGLFWGSWLACFWRLMPVPLIMAIIRKIHRVLRVDEVTQEGARLGTGTPPATTPEGSPLATPFEEGNPEGLDLDSPV
ncbi:hypothetical protein Y032_0536g3097 [Ancylostoma ceylanicum]|uniref:Uncharacterized protein n=1 Tax=Ancylostoma ceylanicum TaxID=53326 RepID=A0A016WSP0_9BILA|nr:hypothetical protein Y032_0536g3097 [Ancylostoma ceylanicum]